MIEPVSFPEHLNRLRWAQGDHVLIAAPTKCGKTTLVSKLVDRRSHVVSFVSKLRDDTFGREYPGWRRYERWPRTVPDYDRRILLWPKPGKTLRETRDKHREVFREALDRITLEGNRTVVIDEGLYMSEPKFVGLGDEIGMLFYFGRSGGITMVLLTQRPAWIPKVVYSSTTHAWIARTRDRDDLRRLGDFGGLDTREVQQTVARLPRRHDFLYLNPQGDARPAIINTRR